MKFDVIGRIENMDLPDGKTAILYSVYEAVSNSVHSIHDRFGEKNARARGKIGVKINHGEGYAIDSIQITDNGEGFTEKNIESFETSDSRLKYSRGGKGVGRLIWIKTFEEIAVKSRYLRDDGELRSVSFDFRPELEESKVNFEDKPTKNGHGPGSRILLSSLRKPLEKRINKATFLKDLAVHFFPQFLDRTLPEITIDYGGDVESLNDYIEGRIDEPVNEEIEFDVDGDKWKINVDHLFVDPRISTELRNSYLLTAHGRLVGAPISVEKLFDLKSLPDGKAYVCVVSGKPLDERVDQQRMNFRFNAVQEDALEGAVLEAIENHLGEHVVGVRKRQRAVVEKVLAEHPSLASQIDDMDEYVKGLYPGMSDEQIAANLFTLLFREERKLVKEFHKIAEESKFDEALAKKAREIVDDLGDQEKRRLAELTAKRHQILVTANMLLKFDLPESEKYHYEKLIHDLVCPMGKMYETGRYDDHNLWILDDSLAGYEFFASDKSINSVTAEDSSKKEPDIVFFNPLGFRRPETSEPVTIVEFKRPGDGRISSDPVAQVLEYVEELRDKTVIGPDGNVINHLDHTTPFTCYVVCELTKETKKLLKRGIAHFETPGGEGFYGFSPTHNAMIHVLSFQKMIDDALNRNKAYFDAINLPNPSRAARELAARRRAKKDKKREPDGE